MEMHPDGSGPVLNLGAALINLYNEQAEWFTKNRHYVFLPQPEDPNDDYTDVPGVAGLFLLAAMIAARKARINPRDMVEQARAEFEKTKRKAE